METGVQETIRNGLLVTGTGIVFSNAKDGHVYAFDAETGKELWHGQIPANIGTQGIPAMYMVNGRQHLVVSASTPLVWMRRTPVADRPGGRAESAEAAGRPPQAGIGTQEPDIVVLGGREDTFARSATDPVDDMALTLAGDAASLAGGDHPSGPVHPMAL